MMSTKPILRATVAPTSAAAMLFGFAIGSDWVRAAGVPALDASAAGYEAYSSDAALPNHFTTPRLTQLDNTPADNPITDAGAELGRVLFYDARLSHNNGTACSSCHTQETGFADPEQFSTGFDGGQTGRHSMALSNARWYRNGDGEGRFFWDERAATLEEQVLGPIQDEVEMGSGLTQLVAELNDTEFYPVLFQRAFGDSAVTSDRMSRALAQFVRSMASYQAPFDEAAAAGRPGRPDFSVLDVDETARGEIQQGHALFQASCEGCHRTEAHVSEDTHNIGLPRIDADDDGVLDPVDPGAGGRTFKAPSLRNIAVRGRFMHDGRFSSLEEVVEHYSSGVVAAPNLAPGLPPGGLNLTQAEKDSLLAFLRTLTDTEFLMSELFSNPLVTLAGDYDGSGAVDSGDYEAWAAQFGMRAEDVSGPLDADGNGDGRVDAADYGVWRDNLGARWDDAVAALVQAVPEPAAVWLAVLGAGVAIRRRVR